MLDDNRAKWSESGRGWIVTKAKAVDVVAYAEFLGLMVVHTKPRNSSGGAT